uniref:Uncharacterized protein n=1 Tax=Panagrolaimus sp. ES5 TaxID=591445 RepID=A0AC34F5J5_9BILA
MDTNITAMDNAKILGQNLTRSSAMPLMDFRQSYIQYLIPHVKGRLLLKLMKSNKWFIPSKSKFKLNECSKSSSTHYTWNTGNLILDGIHDEKNSIPLFFQNCLYCELISVRILDTTVQFDDLKYLLTGGNIKHVFLCNVKVVDDKGNVVLIDDIIDLTPNIYGLYIIGETFLSVTNKMAYKLLQTDIKFMRLLKAPDYFDLAGFMDILKPKNIRIDSVYVPLDP